MKNTLESYGLIARWLHWFMALAIIAMIGVGMWMVNLPNSPSKGTIITAHKSLGFMLLFFFVFRVYWRLSNVTPALPESLPRWQNFAAHINHLILYLYMAAMLLSGTFMSLLGGWGINWFGLGTISWPYINKDVSGLLHTLHVNLTDYAWVFLAAHIAVAFYHHGVLKDRILMRMIGIPVKK